MKDYLLALNKNFIFKSMKTILFTLPILLLVNDFYINHYGHYYFDLRPEFILTFLLSTGFIYSLVIFAIVFIAAYLLEKLFLPASIMMFLNGFSERKAILYKTKIIDRFFPQQTQFAFFQKLNEDEKFAFYQMIMVIPVTSLLWSIYLNRWYCYVVLCAVLLITYLVAKATKTIKLIEQQ